LRSSPKSAGFRIAEIAVRILDPPGHLKTEPREIDLATIAALTPRLPDL
jgi:hypothetical protein